MQIFVAGSTFAVQATLKTDAETVDATRYVVMAQLHSADSLSLIAKLSVEWVNPAAGVFNLTYRGDTSAWPAGKARIDVEVTDAEGNVAYSTPEFFRIDRPPMNVFTD
jgi:hypothetical protein